MRRGLRSYPATYTSAAMGMPADRMPMFLHPQSARQKNVASAAVEAVPIVFRRAILTSLFGAVGRHSAELQKLGLICFYMDCLLYLSPEHGHHALPVAVGGLPKKRQRWVPVGAPIAEPPAPIRQKGQQYNSRKVHIAC